MEVKQLNGDPVHTGMLSPVVKSELPPRHSPHKGMCLENKELLNAVYSAHKATFVLWHQVLDSGSHRDKIKEYVVSKHT